MPGTTNVGQNIRELEHIRKHPSESSVPALAKRRTFKQDVAIAESQARKAQLKANMDNLLGKR